MQQWEICEIQVKVIIIYNPNGREMIDLKEKFGKYDRDAAIVWVLSAGWEPYAYGSGSNWADTFLFRRPFDPERT